VDKITGGKPIIVVNTHEHYDHAYGDCRFDKVYCHEFLVPYLKTQHEHMWDYLFDAFGNNIWLEFDRKDLPRFKKYEIIADPDGYDYKVMQVSGNSGTKRDRMHRFIKGFSTSAYTQSGIYPPKE
jgi:hypothetical protein